MPKFKYIGTEKQLEVIYSVTEEYCDINKELSSGE